MRPFVSPPRTAAGDTSTVQFVSRCIARASGGDDDVVFKFTALEEAARCVVVPAPPSGCPVTSDCAIALASSSIYSELSLYHEVITLADLAPHTPHLSIRSKRLLPWKTYDCWAVSPDPAGYPKASARHVEAAVASMLSAKKAAPSSSGNPTAAEPAYLPTPSKPTAASPRWANDLTATPSPAEIAAFVASPSVPFPSAETPEQNFDYRNHHAGAVQSVRTSPPRPPRPSNPSTATIAQRGFSVGEGIHPDILPRHHRPPQHHSGGLSQPNSGLWQQPQPSGQFHAQQPSPPMQPQQLSGQFQPQPLSGQFQSQQPTPHLQNSGQFQPQELPSQLHTSSQFHVQQPTPPLQPQQLSGQFQSQQPTPLQNSGQFQSQQPTPHLQNSGQFQSQQPTPHLQNSGQLQSQMPSPHLLPRQHSGQSPPQQYTSHLQPPSGHFQAPQPTPNLQPQQYSGQFQPQRRTSLQPPFQQQSGQFQQHGDSAARRPSRSTSPAYPSAFGFASAPSTNSMHSRFEAPIPPSVAFHSSPRQPPAPRLPSQPPSGQPPSAANPFPSEHFTAPCSAPQMDVLPMAVVTTPTIQYLREREHSRDGSKSSTTDDKASATTTTSAKNEASRAQPLQSWSSRDSKDADHPSITSITSGIRPSRGNGRGNASSTSVRPSSAAAVAAALCTAVAARCQRVTGSDILDAISKHEGRWQSPWRSRAAVNGTFTGHDSGANMRTRQVSPPRDAVLQVYSPPAGERASVPTISPERARSFVKSYLSSGNSVVDLL
ncbi:hypothetical protein DIPPA_12344 [Diplonema papillatum]|nr:hypothetical protein DIPPA_12344 [Diplonema papillatum]